MDVGEPITKTLRMEDYDKGVKRVRKGDAVEVVRCHDCVHGMPCDRAGQLVCSVRMFSKHYVSADGYCSDGMRREATNE